MGKPTLSAQLATAIAERDAERAAVAGLADQLAQTKQQVEQLANRVNAEVLDAAERRGGIKLISLMANALIGVEPVAAAGEASDA